ncbi:hypothetical protein KDL44_02645 [bacterium]|nr:hypothetical protein [bacterium]
MRYFPLNFIGVALCLYSVLTVSWQLAVLIVVILAAANSAMSRLQPEPPLEKLMRIEDSELEPYRDEIRDLCFRMLSSERKRKGSALGRLDLGNADESATSVKVLDKILRQAEFGEGENGLASAGGTGPRRLDIVAKLTALQMLSSLLHEDEVDSSVAHEADLLSH